MPLEGLKLIVFESRRAREIELLLRNQGADPLVCGALREVPIEENTEAFAFGEKLLAGAYEMLICLTGVGTRYLVQVLETRHPRESILAALERVTLVARGPKPVAALREMGLAPAVTAGAPNTWREVLAAVEKRPERRVAVQEYGRREERLLSALQQLEFRIDCVPVYQWALPEDLEPLRQAVRRLAAGEFSAAVFTTSIQVDHVIRIASDLGLLRETLEALRSLAIVSIGPTTTEAIESAGLAAAFEPSQSKMGILVHELAAAWPLARAKS